jgi:hypothetical protein
MKPDTFEQNGELKYGVRLNTEETVVLRAAARMKLMRDLRADPAHETDEFTKKIIDMPFNVPLAWAIGRGGDALLTLVETVRSYAVDLQTYVDIRKTNNITSATPELQRVQNDKAVAELLAQEFEVEYLVAEMHDQIGPT